MKRSRSTTSHKFSSNKRLKSLLQTIRIVAFDFDGVFTDNMVYVMEDGREAVRCSRGDGIGLRALERIGLAPIILSTEPNRVVAARAAKLRVRCIHGLDDKVSALASFARELGVTLHECAFVGNDVNDIPCLRAVRIPIAVRDAHPDVMTFVQYYTETRGGYGAVREVCDWFVRALDEA